MKNQYHPNNAINRYLNTLSDNQRNTLLDFLSDNEGIKTNTARLYIQALTLLGRSVNNKNYKQITRRDITTFLSNRILKETSKNLYRILIRQFYKWLIHGEMNIKTPLPHQVKNLTLQRAYSRKLSPNDIFREQEIKELNKYSLNSRDLAIIWTAYDSGLRPGELLSLKISDYQEIEKYPQARYLQVREGKTGPRNVSIVKAVPYIEQYLNTLHPDRNNSQLPLFVNLRNTHKPISYRNYSKIFKRLLSRSNYKNKPRGPHILRHSSATYWCKRLSSAQMCRRFGWRYGSSSLQVYQHLADSDVDEAVLRDSGIQLQIEQTKPEPIIKLTQSELNERISNAVKTTWEDKLSKEFQSIREEALEWYKQELKK